MWIGGKLSAIARLALTSFLRHGHEVRLLAYTDIPNLPAGVTLLDGRDVLPHAQVERFAGFPVQFSDWFRWRLLGERGGTWVDCDMLCLRPFVFDRDLVFGNESDGQPNTAVLKVPKGHALAEFIDVRCAAPNRWRPEDDWGFRLTKLRRFAKGNGPGAITWGEAGGPVGIARAVRVLSMAHLAVPFTWFYPVHWMQAGSLFDRTLGGEQRFFAETYGVHIWNSHLYKIGLGSEGPFDPQSIIGRWMAEHGIACA